MILGGRVARKGWYDIMGIRVCSPQCDRDPWKIRIIIKGHFLGGFGWHLGVWAPLKSYDLYEDDMIWPDVHSTIPHVATHFKDEHILPPAVCISGCCGSSDQKNEANWLRKKWWILPQRFGPGSLGSDDQSTALKHKVGPVYHLQMWFYPL